MTKLWPTPPYCALYPSAYPWAVCARCAVLFVVCFVFCVFCCVRMRFAVSVCPVRRASCSCPLRFVLCRCALYWVCPVLCLLLCVSRFVLRASPVCFARCVLCTLCFMFCVFFLCDLRFVVNIALLSSPTLCSPPRIAPKKAPQPSARGMTASAKRTRVTGAGRDNFIQLCVIVFVCQFFPLEVFFHSRVFGAYLVTTDLRYCINSRGEHT